MKQIQMVDLTTQYSGMQAEMDEAVLNAVRSGQYINGQEVQLFADELLAFTGSKHLIPCANGTDALQIALMSLHLQAGDEVIVPAFTYAAAAEAVVLLGLTPVVVDVCPDTFNINTESLRDILSSRTKAIIPVHLFGQTANMNDVLKVADQSGLFVIEDNAQSISSLYTLKDGTQKQAGTIGDIGTLSFFPSKNLGAYGDGGALLTDDESLARELKMIASHGQSAKYRHELIGCNSRLDTLQAAILRVKLRHLQAFVKARQEAAAYYDQQLAELADFITVPKRSMDSTHVYHQYTLRINKGSRDDLKNFLAEQGIPTCVYYPFPLHHQPAFRNQIRLGGNLNVSEQLCKSALSLPMHTELDREQQSFIASQIKRYYESL